MPLSTVYALVDVVSWSLKRGSHKFTNIHDKPKIQLMLMRKANYTVKILFVD